MLTFVKQPKNLQLAFFFQILSNIFMDIKSSKINTLKGFIEIPSDKSISHRAVMFSAIAQGEAVISNFSRGADCHSTLKIVEKLGSEITFLDEKTIKIKSNGISKPKNNILDCGNSGTTMRLISGVLAGQNFDSILIGDQSLQKRPMKRIINPLSAMGANIEHNEFKAPLTIKGSKLKAIAYHSELSSAQVKSCIILAGLNADGTTSYTEPYKSRNHTELMLEYLGANIKTNGNTIQIEKSDLEAKNINVAGDISSAAFFMVAATIVPNSDIIIKNVGLNQTRTGILDVLLEMGANIQILDKKNIAGEDVGDVRIKYSEIKGIEISGEIIPRLIDELPIIAILATQATGTTIVKNAQDLRNKESDRISCLVKELVKIGINIEETPDGFIINGKQKIKGGAKTECYHDHRLAMSLYVAGLIAENPIQINEFQWVDISFPEFIELMEKLKA